MLPLPALSDIISTTTAGVTTITNFLLPLAWFALAIIIGAMVVNFVISRFARGVGKIAKTRRGGRRRRR